MSNRRKNSKLPKKKKSSKVGKKEAKMLIGSSRAPREAVAIVLCCLGTLTLLSLGSFTPGDVSLNASSNTVVRNWIGPAGAYWADFLLQTLGVGAFALSAGLLLAGWRALSGKRVIPAWREAIGTAFFMVSVGTLAHLFLADESYSYPSGGVAGVLLGELLHDQFASVGAYIVSTSFVLISITMTANGVLVGLGHRGLGGLHALGSYLHAGKKLFKAKQHDFQRKRAQLDETENKGKKVKKARYNEEPTNLNEDLKDSKEKVNKKRKFFSFRLFTRKVNLTRIWGIRNKPIESHLRKRMDSMGKQNRNQDFSLLETQVVEEEPFVLGAMEHLNNDDVNYSIVKRVNEEPISLKQNEILQESNFIETEQGDTSIREEPLGLPQIIDVRPDVDPKQIERAAEENEIESVKTSREMFKLPPATLLGYVKTKCEVIDEMKLQSNAIKLTNTLKDYRIDGKVREIRPGPIVTMYEYKPAAGIKLSKIAGLADDLAMSMEALRVRIVAPIPGKGAVGIEIPNETRETVYLKELIIHESFRNSNKRLPVVLGKDIEGNPYVADWSRMPHLLVAGATGSGKSVFVNTVIMSILFQKTPDEVRFIMIDPKMLELSVYDGIPHLLLPVVTDPKKATLALRWAVDEMENRYQLLSDLGVRHIDGYNRKVKEAAKRGELLRRPTDDEDIRGEVCEPLPYLVIIVDELADLMMTASKDVEASIMRLAQKARASGIHLLLATQRPSVDVLTGVIKANFPTRIAFQVASRHDSRTILDSIGAENLLGSGDMLYLSPGGGLMRAHGAYVDEDEIDQVVSFLKVQGTPDYREEIVTSLEKSEENDEKDEPVDEMYDKAIALVADSQTASISMIQRRLRVGYNRAARMIERMESDGIVGPPDGSKGRDVFVSSIPI